jgi:hypothetical protein
MFNINKGALKLHVAAAILNESIEDTREMMYRGDLQGLLDKDGDWWVLQESIEKMLGVELNIVRAGEVE